MSVAALLAVASPGRILTRLAGLGYPAAAAWSAARRLRDAHAGALIRVRRSSDNAEQDIGATAAGPLDTAALLAFCGAGSGFVAKVYDQGGGGYDMAQATAAAQTRIVNAGALETLGTQARPALNFVSAGHSLENATFTHGNAVTANLVAVSDGNSPAATSIIGNTTGGGGRVRIGGGGPAYLGDTTQIGGVIAAGTAMIVTATAPGLGTVTGRRRVNGTQDATAAISRTASGAGVIWGGHLPGSSGNFLGRCAEVIAFAAVPGDALLALLERDQGTYYGITVA